MHSPFIGELLGTMVLIILGDGVVAGVLLKESKAEGAGWMAISTAWGFAVMCGIFVATATGSKDAHLNPAITIAFAVINHDSSKLAPYIAAQMLGGFLGATIVWLHYLPHWRATEDASLKLACFSTGPAIRDLKANALSEIIATFVLVLVVAAIGSKAVGSPLAIQPGLAPYLVGMLVWVIGLSLGGTTGYAINPARDLGPRLAHALLPIAGKAGSDWGYAAVPVLAPIAGAIGAALCIRGLGVG
jgi:glycerol uptake facilitator protein